MSHGWKGMADLARRDIRVARSCEKFFRENKMLPPDFGWRELQPFIAVLLRSTNYDEEVKQTKDGPVKRYYYGVIHNGRHKMLSVGGKLHEWIQAEVNTVPQMIEIRRVGEDYKASLVEGKLPSLTVSF